MKKRNKSLIILIVMFFLITLTGAIYTLGFQQKDLDIKDKKLDQLRANFSSLEALKFQLKKAEEKVAVVDSLLFSGRFTIPQNIKQSNFFNFIDSYSGDYSVYTFTNTEYVSQGSENGFNYYIYKVSGNNSFDNVYGLVYAIEHSKELKKIMSANVSGTTTVDSKTVPHYLVKFDMQVKVYFSSSDRYAEVNYKENNLGTPQLYDAYFPLVRNEIRPNVNNLPDIQDATLISLVPQGAYIIDSNGNTLLMKKGDSVYLGYLDDIDYENETVTFVLNKGGIIEYETLKIGKKNQKEGK